MISVMEKRKSVGGGDGMIVLNKVVKVGFMEMVILIRDLKEIIVCVIF